MKTLLRLAALLSFAAFAPPASADTVINISGTANGEQTGGADCTVACEGALIDPVQVTFMPGTYELTDAWSPSGGLQPGALYDAWNFEAGNGQAWAWHWKILFDDGSDGSTITPTNYASFILDDIDAAFPADSFTSESIAANFGFNTAPTIFTVISTEVLDFVVNDYDLADNAGGVSLDATCIRGACLQTTTGVPEPGTLALLGAGLCGFALRRRRRK